VIDKQCDGYILSHIVSSPSLTPTPPVPNSQFTFGGYAAAATLPAVSFWPRAAARVIDMILINVAALASLFFFGIVIGVAGVLAGRSPAWIHERLDGFSFAALFCGLIGAMLFHAAFEGLHGSSPGKLILGQVVLSEDGMPCSFKAALGRSCAYLIDALFFGAVAYLAMSGSPLQQRHGDKWFRTVVCKRSEVDPTRLRPGGRFVAALAIALLANAGFVGLGLVARLVL
jgi:uncharacterized RDD family membrane protein YckC